MWPAALWDAFVRWLGRFIQDDPLDKVPQADADRPTTLNPRQQKD